MGASRDRVRCLAALLVASALLCAGGVTAPVASAQVDVSGARIVVQGSGARAVIDRAPFRLQVLDGAGHAALSEVPNSGQAPQVEPPTVDPQPPGVDNQSTTTLYAPLSFTVGTETLEQQPAGEWQGNLLSGLRSGIQYSARNVVSAQPDGRGVRLVVSTSDPSGRTLVVTVAPDVAGAIHVSATPDPAAGVSQVGDSFGSDGGEGFFGFGGRHNALDQRGNVISSFVNEENLAGQVGPVKGPGLALFPNGGTAAYYPQAEFFSSRDYGFLLDQPELGRFKLDVDRPDAWNVTASAPKLDYVVAPGAGPRAIRTVTSITGRQPVAPRWALGPMLDRLVKNAGESQDDYESKLADDLRNIDRYHLPLTAYRIEGSGLPGGNDGLSLHTYTSPGAQQKMVGELRKRGIHPLFYLRPWLEPDSQPVKDGYAVRDSNGNPATVVVSGGTQVALVDFTNPAAVRWWQHEVEKVFDLGFDGFMQDYGEHVLFDMRFADGSTGVTEHNRYLSQYARATRGEIDAYQRAHPKRQLWFFTRAGYTGRPGSAAYEGGNFPGDETTDWGHESGLKSLTTDMLSRAVGGAYGFGTDIGGYLDYTTPPTNKELFLRWAEWAALSPIFRLHGTGLAGTHTPWSYDAETVGIYNQLSQLHLEAAPLIQQLWRQAASTGMPVTRPLWLQYPGDAQARRQDQEWLLGANVLVAPVVDEGARSRSVYFPSGCWRSAAGQRHVGPGSATVSAPLGQLPYFFRCGTPAFCARALGRIHGTRVGPAVLGRTRKRQRRIIGARLKSARGGIDRYCVSDGGNLRIGYPTRRLDRGLSHRLRRRIRGRAQVALTANKHVAIAHIHVGSRVRTLRRRLRGERRYRVGRNLWYVAPGRHARQLFKTRRGRVLELGLAGKRLTRSRRATRHLLNAWHL